MTIGTPRQTIRPVNAFDPAHKKPAGIGSREKSVKVDPSPFVTHESIPA